MNILFVDIDTLRPDHMSCYGYPRLTTPNLDRVAERGVRFDRVYTSDSPCLPSRTALVTGRFGFSSGVINHGGRRADPYPTGPERGRRNRTAMESWVSLLRGAGYWCASISTFAERHSAFHWYAGFNEVINLGRDGMETADQVAGAATSWLNHRGRDRPWFLHVHLWDPHTPYRTPDEYGRPFHDSPPPTWIDRSVIAEHRLMAGPHSAQEVTGWGPSERYAPFPRQPQEIASPADVEAMIDGYDTAIHFADHHIGRLLDEMVRLGLTEDTAVMVSSDHGENLGELGIYCDHQTADEHTHHVPMILAWPGADLPPVDDSLRYQMDVAATVVELAGGHLPESWDGRSFADTRLSGQVGAGRPHLVLSAAAWAAQRSVRFGPWLCLRTYHDAFHGFPEVMLFDLDSDVAERHDQASQHPEVVGEGLALLDRWVEERLESTPDGVDPMATVLDEGGGYYVRRRLGPYLERLRGTGRGERADAIAARMVARSGRG
jgi:choline-sulfatase